MRLAKDVEITDLASFDDAMGEVIRGLGETQTWWRGHARVDWKLQAHVFRRDFHESGLLGNFRMKACGRLGHRRRPETTIEWLFLAQHYGLPTRLLDWTENALVGLYFSVEDKQHDEEDACLWAFKATKFNQTVDTQGLAFLHDPRIVNMVEAALDPNALEAKVMPAVAIAAHECDERMVAQYSAFTLHATADPLEDRGGADDFLRRFIIPAKAKATNPPGKYVILVSYAA